MHMENIYLAILILIILNLNVYIKSKFQSYTFAFLPYLKSKTAASFPLRLVTVRSFNYIQHSGIVLYLCTLLGRLKSQQIFLKATDWLVSCRKRLVHPILATPFKVFGVRWYAAVM